MKRFLNAFVFDMVAAMSFFFAVLFAVSAGHFTFSVHSGITLTWGGFSILLAFYSMAILFAGIWVMFGLDNFRNNR